MILSSFSHFSFLHMAANMYVLWSFSTSAVSMLGREQFVAVYLSAGTGHALALALALALIGRPLSPLTLPCPQGSFPPSSATPVKWPPGGSGPRWEP